MDEFDLIKRYFEPLQVARSDIKLGIGDDAAVVDLDAPGLTAIAVDTLVEGIHFPPDMAADAVGYRALAVNLSDFAAMGAQPKYATLALTLPSVNAPWLELFAAGLGEALNAFDTALIGGDTTRGPLTITVQLVGVVESQPMSRAGAQPDDVIVVSGTLGDARAGLELLNAQAVSPSDDEHKLIERFMRPQARLALGQAVRPHAHAAIDISDGLLADIGHIMSSSGCRAEVELDRLPLSPEIRAVCGASRAIEYAATGGDDYELALCVAPGDLSKIMREAGHIALPLTAIGSVLTGTGVVCRNTAGDEVIPSAPGYRHFDH